MNDMTPSRSSRLNASVNCLTSSPSSPRSIAISSFLALLSMTNFQGDTCHAGTAAQNSATPLGECLALRLHDSQATHRRRRMPKRSLLVIALALTATGLPITEAVAADVNVGINIGVPAPPRIVLAAPPPVVVVPNTPVSYVPSVNFNLFVYSGRDYTFHDGAWFQATTHSGPWAFIATERAPPPVVAVPVTYYKVPPGHAKRMGPPAAAPAARATSPPHRSPRHASNRRSVRAPPSVYAALSVRPC